MNSHEEHISDQELLQFVDGELSPRGGAKIKSHLEACWQCRARQMEFNRTIERFVAACHSDTDTGIPPIDGPRAQLRARLSQLQSIDPDSSWQRFTQGFAYFRAAIYAGIATAIVAVVAFVLYFGVHPVRAASIPDMSLTPGATRTSRIEDVCSTQPAGSFYPIPTTLAYKVFEKYRIRNPRPRSYEVDYLISPTLGGADDIRNLWPQPYSSGEWNAHVKDALEDHLHELVCSGKVDLATAQQDIAANWIAAYKKYFGTDHPLPIHIAFSIDAPWEN